MKTIRTMVAATLLGGVAMAAAAQAPQTAQGPHGRHGWGRGHLYSQLDLTADQQASVKAIFEAEKPQMKSLHEQMKANHLKLIQTSPDDPNYAGVVAEVAASNATLASQRTTQSEHVRAEINALLTPAQKTQLTTLEAERATHPWRHAAAPQT